MSRFLTHLVERTLGLVPVLEPRPRGRFEPLTDGLDVLAEGGLDAAAPAVTGRAVAVVAAPDPGGAPAAASAAPSAPATSDRAVPAPKAPMAAGVPLLEREAEAAWDVPAGTGGRPETSIGVQPGSPSPLPQTIHRPPGQPTPEPRWAGAPASPPPALAPPVVPPAGPGDVTLSAPAPERSLRDAVRAAVPPVFRPAEQPPQPPRVTVNIGRVEVRTTPEPGRSAEPRPRPSRRAQPDRAARPLSLGDYLARRTEEGGPR